MPKAIVIVVVAALAASEAELLPGVTITATARADEVGHEQLQAVRLIIRPPALDSDILALDEPELAKDLAECSRPPPCS
jgi:hypothetical protein